MSGITGHSVSISYTKYIFWSGKMDMIIDFPGGARVDAHFGPFTVATDQPPQGGGEGSAPTPFEVFLSSIGTCVGIFIVGFCRQRGLSTEGIRIIQRNHASPM